MNRRYGLEGLPQLFANFKQVYTDLKLLSSQMNEIGLSDSLFVLEKASTIEELFDIEIVSVKKVGVVNSCWLFMRMKKETECSRMNQK